MLPGALQFTERRDVHSLLSSFLNPGAQVSNTDERGLCPFYRWQKWSPGGYRPVGDHSESEQWLCPKSSILFLKSTQPGLAQGKITLRTREVEKGDPFSGQIQPNFTSWTWLVVSTSHHPHPMPPTCWVPLYSDQTAPLHRAVLDMRVLSDIYSFPHKMSFAFPTHFPPHLPLRSTLTRLLHAIGPMKTCFSCFFCLLISSQALNVLDSDLRHLSLPLWCLPNFPPPKALSQIPLQALWLPFLPVFTQTSESSLKDASHIIALSCLKTTPKLPLVLKTQIILTWPPRTCFRWRSLPHILTWCHSFPLLNFVLFLEFTASSCPQDLCTCCSL